MPITDLESMFLPKQPWPPTSEAKRQSMYRDNRRYFEGEHSEVWPKETQERIERVIGNYQKVVSFPVILNFLKLLSLKTADLLFGEPPRITGKSQDALDALVEASDLHNTGYTVALDVSRFGDGILLLSVDAVGQKVIGYTQPAYWYPVVDPLNMSRVLYQVLASVSADGKQLTVRIYDDTSVEERVYGLNDGAIGARLSAKKTAHGFALCPVIPVHNLLTSDRTTGIDDYSDLDSLVTELSIRCAQVARVLDVFTDPTFQGPSTAMEFDDATQKLVFRPGRFIKREDTSQAPVEAVVWDASMQAHFTFIERALGLLHNLTEMGALIFADQAAKTGDVTGPGMKRLLQQALAKVNRIRMRFDPALRRALAAIAGGEPRDIRLEWRDGLPEDAMEQTQIVSQQYTAGLISLESALRRLGWEGDELQAELARIKAEQPAPPEIPALALNNEPDAGGNQTNNTQDAPQK